ncbi:MAG: hypothetical protein HYY57_05030 [Candidatus Omnitrophica bacterium]|nr:hypothetical protein [Candidatus Omnitrophota bacterium]
MSLRKSGSSASNNLSSQAPVSSSDSVSNVASTTPSTPESSSTPAVEESTSVGIEGLADGEKIAFTFPDEAKMKEFEELWQKRQRTMWRMAVVRGYWTEEQGALTELSNQMMSEYHLDPQKGYRYDPNRRVLVEESGEPQATTPELAPESSTDAGSEKVVYTFADETQVSEFGMRWQQRQGIILRMSAIQSYWDQDQITLNQLNDQLASAYKLDPEKFYSLDRERKVLIEREAPPPTPAAATTEQAPEAAPQS